MTARDPYYGDDADVDAGIRPGDPPSLRRIKEVFAKTTALFRRVVADDWQHRALAKSAPSRGVPGKAPKRRSGPRLCAICRVPGHTRRTCPVVREGKADVIEDVEDLGEEL